MHDDRQLREIFHFCFLESLLKVSDPRLYILKGGVNLRFFFQSPRYSEDMDLDVIGGQVETLKKNGYKVINQASFKRKLRTYGIEDIEVNNPSRAKHTQTTQRFRMRLITTAGESLPTKIEFSRRSLIRNKTKAADTFNLHMINPEIAHRYQKLAFRCQHYCGEFAVLQKIQALAGRAVTQARDVFDLSILHRGGFVKKTELIQKLSPKICRQAENNLLSLSFDDFSNQVLDYLEDSERDFYGHPQAWKNMQTLVLGLFKK